MGVFEPHAAVQRHEALAGQRELHDQYRACLAAGAVDSVFLHFLDSGIRQQRNIEFRGLLGLAVETTGRAQSLTSVSSVARFDQAAAVCAAEAAATSIHITSQMWPSGSSKLRPYM